MKMSEMIVLSTFGALVLGGIYVGQQYFVPDEAEAPAESVTRFTEHKRTFEVKATGTTCQWAKAKDLKPLPASFDEEEGLEATPAIEKTEMGVGGYNLVIADGCDEPERSK